MHLLYTSDLDITRCKCSRLTSFSINLLYLVYIIPDYQHIPTLTVGLLNSPPCRYLNSMRSLLFYKRILYLLYLYKSLILQISFLFSIFSLSCYFYFVGVCTHACMPWSENNLGNLFFPSTMWISA